MMFTSFNKDKKMGWGLKEKEVPVSSTDSPTSDSIFKLKSPWWTYSHLRKLHFCIFVVSLTATNNGYDGSMLNGLQIFHQWHVSMGHPHGPVLGALSNGNTFGNLLSFGCASILSDRIGRRKSIIIGNVISIIGAVLQGASTDYTFFLVSRIVIGFGSGIATVSSPSLISELSYPLYRPVLTSLFNVYWYLGALVAAWICYGARDLSTWYIWKIPSYLQGFFPVLQVLLMCLVPESPRFLVSKGKVEEARKVLQKFHTGNSQEPECLKIIEHEMNDIKIALEVEKTYSATTSYSDFLTLKTFRKRLFLILFTAGIMQLSGNGLVSYYLNRVLESIGITSTKRKLQINGFLMLYNLFIAGFGAYASGRVKRRPLFLFAVTGMFVTYLIWTVLSAINQERHFKDTSLANGVIAMIFLYYLFYSSGANGVPFLYVTELLPYNYRAKGLNIFNLAQQILVVYNGFINPIAMDAIEWKYYIVFTCVLVVEIVVVYFVYVETAGYNLEDVAVAFGDDPKHDGYNGKLDTENMTKDQYDIEYGDRVE